MANHYPDWVQSHKLKGREIKRIQGKYYLYEVSSYYDKTQKRTRKKSGAFLGRITETGLQAKGGREPLVMARNVCVKEYGASEYLLGLLSEESALLQKHLPMDWQGVLICAIFRLLHQSAFKQMDWHYSGSYLSELYPNVGLSGKQISGWLRRVGDNRAALVAIMQGLQGGEELIIIDNTHITTQSRLNLSAQQGYNSQRQFDPQINLLYLFAQDTQMPVFYRCVQGSVREIRALQLTLQESGLKRAILVADKGFYSLSNVTTLETGGWQYILPLRRNATLAQYNTTEASTYFDAHFLYDKRAIWYKVHDLEGKSVPKRVILFFDPALKAQEAQDYLIRVSQDKEGYDMETYHQKQVRFGTITVLTNTTIAKVDNNVAVLDRMSPQTVFEHLKSRNDIEQLNDTYKNVLEADKTYMQSDATMEAWHFINFLALRAYYRLFATLVQKKLTAQLSPSDVLLLLQSKRKVKINTEWIDAEIPKKTQDLLLKINQTQIAKPVT
jgi:transposase